MTEQDRQTSTNSKRQSIWSIRAGWTPLYFSLFIVQVIAGDAIIIWQEMSLRTHDDAYDTFVGIIQGIGWVGLASAINTFTIIETLEVAMVMAQWIRQKYLEPLKERQRAEWRAEGIEAGREEGRAELIEEMKDWDSRRRESEARGETFDEPPPYLQNGAPEGR